MHTKILLHIYRVGNFAYLERIEWNCLRTSIPSLQFSAIVDVVGDNIDEDKDPTKSSSSCIIREHLILWQPSSVFFQNVLTHSNTYLEWLLEEYAWASAQQKS